VILAALMSCTVAADASEFTQACSPPSANVETDGFIRPFCDIRVLIDGFADCCSDADGWISPYSR
jgi:hypothetical protein